MRRRRSSPCRVADEERSHLGKFHYAGKFRSIIGLQLIQTIELEPWVAWIPAQQSLKSEVPDLGILGVGVWASFTGNGQVRRGEVAIKTLTEATEELRQRFLLEARSGVLNHPTLYRLRLR